MAPYYLGAKGIITRQGIKFMIKDSDPYLPIKGKQDKHFPPIDQLDYNNWLVAINYIPSNFEYKFCLKDGANCGTKSKNSNWSCLQNS